MHATTSHPIAKRALPTQIAIELSNRCNARCIICPLFQGNEKMDRKRRKPLDMEPQVFLTIAEKVKIWNPNATIYLNMFGEPLLNANIKRIFTILNDLGLSRNVYLQTNSTFMTDDIVKEIVKNNIGMVVPCLDAADKKTFEKIRPGVTFESSLNSIINLAKVRDRYSSNTNISIQYVHTKINDKSYKDVYNLLSAYLSENDRLNISSATAWSSPQLRNLTFLNFSSQQKQFSCDMLDSSMIILADGNICACCHDYNTSLGIFGNAFSDDLDSVWNSDNYLKLKESIANGNSLLPELCKKCTFLFASYEKMNFDNYGFDNDLVQPGHHGVTVAFKRREPDAHSTLPRIMMLVKKVFPQNTTRGRLIRRLFGARKKVSSDVSQEKLVECFKDALKKVTPHQLPSEFNDVYSSWQWLVAAGKILCPEYKFLWPQLDWWKDKKFAKYLQSIDEVDGFNSYRRWNANQMLRLVGNVAGDMAECGVYKGATAALLISASCSKHKHVHLFDSFEGVSKPGPEDGNHWEKGFLSSGEGDVAANLSKLCPGCTNYTLHKGWIPEKFSHVADVRFSFVHIDVDLYEPTKQSIEFFYPRLNNGGVCICDDYGFSTCPGATKAINDFLSDKPEKMISLASGGGFFIKGSCVDG